MISSFADFSTSLLLNYWRSSRDSMLNEFMEENLPFLLSENTGYTAYEGTTYNEEAIEKSVKSVSFKTHPHFTSTYTHFLFSVLLKMLNNKCIGYYSVQVSFFYETKADLEISLNDFKALYLDFPNTQIIPITNNTIEIKTSNVNDWPSSVFLKQTKNTDIEHVLTFSATSSFF